MKFLANLMALWALALPLALAKSCSSGQFLYSAKAECVPLNGNTSRDAESAPSGISCPISPGGWYWSSSRNYCAPSSSSFAQTPSCTRGFKWHSFGSACVKDTPSRSLSNCGMNEFWWSERESCLSSTYSPRTIPPSGSKCPTGSWTWNSKLGCCTPQVPQYSEPKCPGGWSWVKGVAQCRPRSGAPAPMPSGHMSDNHYKSYAYGKRDYVPSSHPGPASYRKRNNKLREEKLCPAGLNACPIESAHGLTSDYECLDTLNELTSCGGCASTGEGTDCTAISNARNVGCVQSTCVVSTCSAGFQPGLDKKSCIPL